MPHLTADIDSVHRDIGDALREARADLTMIEAAARIGVSQAAVSMWESGHRQPPLRALPAIAEAYGLTPWVLARRIFARIRLRTRAVAVAVATASKHNRPRPSG